MTRHTLRDLMIGLQGALISVAAYFLTTGGGHAFMMFASAVFLMMCLTPSRLPPRNERGQFSKRD